MHVAEQTNGKFYRPASIGVAASLQGAPGVKEPSGSKYLPTKLKESIWNFLRQRASLLMGGPGLDMKTYQDFPGKDRLDDDENPLDVAVNTFANEYGWPHRWHSWERRFGNPETDPKGRAYAMLNEWRNELRKNREIPRPVIEEIDEILGHYYFGATLHVDLRVRAPKNEYGVCVEDIQPRTLLENLSPNVAQFMATAHNTLIDVMRWLDEDLPRRAEALEARDGLWRQERELEARERALAAREKRHAAAVKRVKTKLAKEKSEAEMLLAEANQRMKEAMTLAELVTKIKETP